MNTKKTAFKNNSIFSGIKQYFDKSGVEWRREYDCTLADGRRCYKFYKEDDYNEAFLFAGSICTRAKTLESIHDSFTDNLYTY